MLIQRLREEIRYDMSIKEIKVKKLPPLEAAFKDRHSVDSEEAFREEVKNRLVDRMTKKAIPWLKWLLQSGR